MKIQPKPQPSGTPSAPTLPPHAEANRTFAEMPDRSSPEWGKPKPQLTVVTSLGDLAKIPKHPAQMTEGELMSRYFDPGYKFDTATGRSTGPFFTQPGRYLESPTREATVPRTLPQDPVQASPGLWGGAAPSPAPGQPSAGLWGGNPPPKPEAAARPEAPVRSDASGPLLPHERPPARPTPPPADRFAGFEGWGRNAGARGGNDYHGSDWD